MASILHDFRFKVSFNANSSLFGHGELRYGGRHIALREHFRCMPEIIRFSNDLCYSDTPLIPLRQYGFDRLPPLVHVYVEDGYREGSSNRAINRPEADRIVEKIVELCDDRRYAGKTMGVIVLQGNAQGHLIEEGLLARLDAEEMQKRRIICGNAYSFQGDERDIIFLSMVAAPKQRIGALARPADKRRFNVAASRAKDQMWLFHSVRREELSSTCLRRRLLEFFEETKVREIAGIDVGELENKAGTANRSIVKAPPPFDSWFEVDIALEIAKRGYRVVPQFQAAGKYIDLVIEGRLAVECDGDEFHGIEEYPRDMERQRILERCGWVFFRVRAAAFYLDRHEALSRLWPLLEQLGIYPIGHTALSGETECPDVADETAEVANEVEEGEGSSDDFDKDEEVGAEVVEVGDTVVYVDVKEPEEKMQASITSSGSMPNIGTINMDTLLAQALLEAAVGEVVEAILPAGTMHFRILEIIKDT